MKFSVSSSELLNGLMSVSKVIVPKPTNSILENFLFQLAGNTLTVTASDGETTLRTDIPIGQVVQEGATAVPAKKNGTSGTFAPAGSFVFFTAATAKDNIKKRTQNARVKSMAAQQARKPSAKPKAAAIFTSAPPGANSRPQRYTA